MTSLINALTAVVPALCLAAYAMLIGFGVQAALGERVRFAIGLGVVCGVGLSVTAVALCLAHVLLGNVSLPLIPLGILALLAIAIRLIRVGRTNPQPVRQTLIDALRTITPADVIGAAAATLIMLPLLRFGLVYWTIGTHDFPNYIASTQIWSTSPADFAQRHPDQFGDYQLSRASFEKPMVTALLVAMSNLSGTPTFQLLAPAMLVFLYVCFACMLTLCSKVFRLGTFGTVVAVFPAGIALIPMSRVYDAQPGQIAAVALVTCLFAVLAATPPVKTIKSAVALGLVAGVVWAAAIGVNFTLVVGSAPLLAALLAWTLAQDRTPLTQRLKVVGLAVVFAGVLSLPMLGMYLKSASIQTTGEHGFDIPLVSPLAAIGQQMSLFQAMTTSQALLSWGVVLLVLLAVTWFRAAHDRRTAIFDLVLIVAAVANALLIGLKLGWVNYAVHKWVAIAIAVAMPLVLSRGLSRLDGRAKVAAMAALAVLVLSSAQISLSRALSIGFVASKDLMMLHASPQLAAEETLNLQLRSSMSESMFAALVVPTHAVTLIDRTYARGSLPEGSRFLVKSDQLERAPYTNVVRLNDTYALASLDLTLDMRSIDFTAAHPEAERLLFGGWYAPEAEGTWSGQRDNILVFDLPADLRNRDVRLVITGHAFANSEAAQEIRVLVNDKPMLNRRYPDDGKAIELTVPADVSETAGGRIAVNFRSLKPLSPSAYGSADTRSLAFMLTSMTIAPL